jgi:hypothetical protein
MQANRLSPYPMVLVTMIVCSVSLATAQSPPQKTAPADDSNARPPVSKVDLLIIRRAGEILNSETVWNRADNRVCPDDAKTFSLYCALEKASKEVSTFEHRSAVMQEARFVIDEIAPKRNYEHRLMNYNNDPSTTFADIKKVMRLVEERIVAKLKANPGVSKSTL